MSSKNGNGNNANGNGHRKYRSYSDEEKAVALAALEAGGGDVALTARKLGMPADTLRVWARGRHIQHATGKIQAEKKKDLADLLEAVAYRLVEIPEDVVEKANLQQRTTSLAIAIDKMRLLREQPTSISENRDAENQVWAESELRAIMSEHSLTREQAVDYVREYAPTLAQWVM